MVQQPLHSPVSHPGSQSDVPYLQHEPYLRRVALALTRGDDAAADDLVQETWLVALNHRPDQPGSERPWLVQVLRNRFRQGRRGSTRRDEREALVARSEIDPCDPALLMAESQVAIALRGALHRLPERYAMPLRLRFYEGLPPRHIASRMGMPVETIRTRLKRGLAGLRRDLCEDGAPRRHATPLAALAAFGRPARNGLHAAPLMPSWLPSWLPIAAALVLAGLGLWAAQLIFTGSSAPPSALVQLDKTQVKPAGFMAAVDALPPKQSRAEFAVETPVTLAQWRIEITDEQGKPLENAEVYTRSATSDHAIALRGVTDGEGLLEIDLEKGAYYIAAKHPESQHRTRSLWVRSDAESAAGEQQRVELVAWPSEGFAFQAVDENLQLITDAEVVLEPVQGAWWGKWDGAGSLLSEAWWLGSSIFEPGRFEIHAEPRRQWRLRVTAPGYADWLSGKFDTRLAPPNTAMMGPPATVEGRVVEAQQPMGGIRVEAKDAVTGDLLGHTYSSGDGAFVIEDLPRGQIQLVASAGPLSAMGIVGTERPQARPYTLRLNTAHSVRGKLVDAEGEPVAGRRVEIARIARMTRSPHPGLQMAPGRETATDEEGRFAFGGVGAGEHRVLIYDSAGLTPIAARMGLHAGEQPLTVLVQPKDAALGSIDLRIPCGGAGEVWLTEHTLHVGTVAQVDAHGHAHLDELLPGLYEVALFRGSEPIDLGNVPLRAGQHVRSAPLGAPPRSHIRLSLPHHGKSCERLNAATPVRIRARSTGETRTLPVIERHVRMDELQAGIQFEIPGGEIVVEAYWGDTTYAARGTAISGSRLALELSQVELQRVRLRLKRPAELPGSGPVKVEVFDEEGCSRGIRHHARQKLSEVQVSVFELPKGAYRAICMRGGAVHLQREFVIDCSEEDQIEISLREP